MDNFIQKLIEIEKEISSKKGSFNLFCLFLPEESSYWDLVVSASWINDHNEGEMLEFISSYVVKKLEKDELLQLSRIVVVDHDDSRWGLLVYKHDVEHGKPEVVEIHNKKIMHVKIEEGYIITLKKPSKKIPLVKFIPYDKAMGLDS